MRRETPAPRLTTDDLHRRHTGAEQADHHRVPAITDAMTTRLPSPAPPTQGTSVTVTDQAGQVVCTIAVVAGNGKWSCNTSALPDGSDTLTATSTDAAGNSTSSSAVTVVVDTTGPGRAGADAECFADRQHHAVVQRQRGVGHHRQRLRQWRGGLLGGGGQRRICLCLDRRAHRRTAELHRHRDREGCGWQRQRGLEQRHLRGRYPERRPLRPSRPCRRLPAASRTPPPRRSRRSPELARRAISPRSKCSQVERSSAAPSSPLMEPGCARRRRTKR